VVDGIKTIPNTNIYMTSFGTQCGIQPSAVYQDKETVWSPPNPLYNGKEVSFLGVE